MEESTLIQESKNGNFDVVKELINNNVYYDFEEILDDAIHHKNKNMLEWLINKKLNHKIKIIASSFDDQNSI